MAMLTRAEVVERLRVSSRTFDRIEQSGLGPVRHWFRGTLRYDAAEVGKWIDERREEK
jgi:hypothetical protein